MIKNKADLRRYLAMDRYALGRERKRPALFGAYGYKFQLTLRYHEYYYNLVSGGGKNTLINRLMLRFWERAITCWASCWASTYR